jgi:hypothetical protein
LDRTLRTAESRDQQGPGATSRRNLRLMRTLKPRIGGEPCAEGVPLLDKRRRLSLSDWLLLVAPNCSGEKAMAVLVRRGPSVASAHILDLGKTRWGAACLVKSRALRGLPPAVRMSESLRATRPKSTAPRPTFCPERRGSKPIVGRRRSRRRRATVIGGPESRGYRPRALTAPA